MTLRLAWFATARGTSSRLLFQQAQAAIAAGTLDAQIVVVFCNRARGQSENTDAFLETVEQAGIPLVTLSSGAWRKRVGGEISQAGEDLAPWRGEFDRAVRERIAPYRPDAGVMAGYMLITTAVLCAWLPLLNLHPAEPTGPVGTWQEVILQLIAGGATTSGILLQRSTVDLDRGPVVTWCRYPIRGPAFDPLWQARNGPPSQDEALFKAIRAAGGAREPVFLLASLTAIAAGRVTIPGPGAEGPAIDLTPQVEAALGPRA